MIDLFRGQHRFLSNFYPAVVELDGVTYPTVEHAYQAAKCKNRPDRQFIRDADTPGDAKRRGRQIQVRADWESVKLGIMEELLRQKFATKDLRDLLLRTGDEELVEGNTWGDTFWGVCCGRGENHLGKLLMEIRSEARRG